MQDACVAVMDTNVLLDWLVFKDARVAALMMAWSSGALVCVACSRMRQELAHMLGSARLGKWSPDAAAALSAYDARVRMEDPPPRNQRLVCTDADDQVFLDLALHCRATWLITHDRALLRLARRARALDLHIVTPTQWVSQAEKRAAAAAL